MKNTIIFICIFLSLNGFAQQRKYSTFYEQRTSLFEELSISPHDIIFLGNSITNGAEWAELFNNNKVKNRGISADITLGVYDRLEMITKNKPAKIFLMIGINDIAKSTVVDSIIINFERIIDKIKEESPSTRIYIQSILPVNPDFGMFQSHMKPDIIKEVNNRLCDISYTHNIRYIDLYSHFKENDTDKMNPAYTNDGLHLLGAGYILWHKIILPYVNE
ncbi:lysophospholipase L1-like esterase [Dysgonomonas alginatilytica]|uniref:Lysophospholipase L1-like esterase n=1 Tax=Dysgonomonas alginatilytica TaxID=1605892 RepID=A0A2V3PYD9_9BACT|nr:GDSL-type esterase/lipase family protein [Dysgonomonas alginatilytica]PXV66802.1 lysophospholipase L1-like esterase [Dysgonomonas alginatilytica]